MNLFNNVVALCKSQNINIRTLETELGLSRSSISKWENSSPSIDKVALVSKRFNVSIEFLCFSDYYRSNDFTALFIDTLICKTQKDLILWKQLSNQDHKYELNQMRYSSYMEKNFSAHYYDNLFQYDDTPGVPSLYDDVVVYFFYHNKTNIYCIYQGIHCDNDDEDRNFIPHETYYYLALKSDNENKYIFRDCNMDYIKKLYDEITYSVHEKKDQQKFDNFINAFINQ